MAAVQGAPLPKVPSVDDFPGRRLRLHGRLSRRAFWCRRPADSRPLRMGLDESAVRYFTDDDALHRASRLLELLRGSCRGLGN